MMTTPAATTSAVPIVDALWAIISPLSKDDQRELMRRIEGTLKAAGRMHSKSSDSLSSIVKSFHLSGSHKPVPVDEMGKGMVAIEKYA